jgi:poly(A) polymerase
VMEIATFRSEGAYLDGRRPSTVRFTTAEEDAQRRDFTINGLFFDPIENKVIDYVGGQADLAAKRLRAIGNPHARFEEDHLRMLRAIRFAARFGFTVDPATAEAIRIAAPKLKGISPERIGDELRLMLTPIARTTAWALLWELKLAPEIFRFLPLTAEFKFAPRDQLFTRLPGNAITMGLALAAATLDLRIHTGPATDPREFLKRPAIQQAVQAMRKAVKISNDESDEMAQTLAGLEPLLTDDEPTVATLKRFLARPAANQSRAMLAGLLSIEIQQKRIVQLQSQFQILEKQNVNPAPFITGDDLTAAGLEPGPAFRAILDTVYDAQLEDKISTKEEAMNLAMRLRPS